MQQIRFSHMTDGNVPHKTKTEASQTQTIVVDNNVGVCGCFFLKSYYVSHTTPIKTTTHGFQSFQVCLQYRTMIQHKCTCWMCSCMGVPLQPLKSSSH